MTCHDVREVLSALVDEALPAEERAAVDAHLQDCVDCRRELDLLRRTVDLLRAVEPARAPAGFVDRVLAAARPAPWPRRVARWLFVPLPVKVPLEAAAVALIAVSALYVLQRSPELRQAAGPPGEPAPLVASRPEPPASPPPAPAPSAPVPSTPAGPEPVSRRQARIPAPPAAAPEATPRLESAPPAAGEKKEAAGEQEPAPAGPVGGAVVPAPESSVSPERKTTEALRDVAKSRPAAPAPAAGVTPPPPAARAKDASEERARSGPAPRAAAPPAALGLLLASDAAGRLAVSDREAAVRALAELVARLGGAVIGRRVDAAAVTLEVVVSRAAYPELLAGLAGLGRWTSEREPAELPPQVRLTVSLSD